MKKFLSLMLIFLMMLGMVACDSENVEAETSDTDTDSTPVEDEEDDTPSDEKPSDDLPPEKEDEPKKLDTLTWEKLNAIPVATSEMSSDELRQICLDYMNLQLTFQWKPSTLFSYTINSMSKQVNFYKDKLYAGLPYDSPSHYGSLYTALDYFDPETGVLDTLSLTGDTLASIVGNHCSGACLWAWGRVSNSMKYWDEAKGEYHYATLTDHLTVSHGFLPVGDLVVEPTVNWSDHDGTSVVCQATGEQGMYEAYAQMLPADGVVTNFLKTNGKRSGHCKMISAVPVVIRNSNGNISGDRSYVMIFEQADEYREETLPDGTTVIYQGAVMRKTTFKELWRDKYVPFTLAEFHGSDPVEKSEVVLKKESGEQITLPSEVYASTLVSNYAIAKVELTVTDVNGDILYTKSRMPSVMQSFTLKMSPLLAEEIGESLQSGQTMTVMARISTGEYVEAYRYTAP